MEESQYNAIIERLYQLHRFGIKPGLERINKLLDSIDNPQNKIKTIHIAGTNGKGSVSSYIASILQSAGYKVGLFNSPHIKKFNERIKINGIEISDADIVENARILLNISEKMETTFFEISAAIGFKYFADNDVDYAVIETGMGGRFDATNAITPLVSIITNIDMDHSEYLGDTLEAIAFEKAGIIKHNVPVVCGETRESLRNVFEKKAQEMNANLYVPLLNAHFDNVNYSKEFITRFHLDYNFNNTKVSYQNIEIPLTGKIQLENATVALCAIEVLKSKGAIISETAIYTGLKDVKKNAELFGRIELLRKEPPIVLDVSHNVAGIKALREALELSGYNEKWNIVIGMMADKEVEKALAELEPICDKLFCSAPNIERAISSDNLFRISQKIGFKNSINAPIISESVRTAILDKKPLLICGSFYVAEEALIVLCE